MGNPMQHAEAFAWRMDAQSRPSSARDMAFWFKVVASLVAAAALAPVVLAVGGVAGAFVAPLAPFFVVAMIPSFRRAVQERSGTYAERRPMSRMDEGTVAKDMQSPRSASVSAYHPA